MKIARWRDGEMERWRDEEDREMIERQRDGEMERWKIRKIKR
jgi:hypothetical protein